MGRRSLRNKWREKDRMTDMIRTRDKKPEMMELIEGGKKENGMMNIKGRRVGWKEEERMMEMGGRRRAG